MTLVELILAVAIVGIITGVAVPLYNGYVTEARIGRAIRDIRSIEVVLLNLALDDDLPADLAALDLDLRDPWGNTYQYLRIKGAPGNVQGQVRRDRATNPLNTDFDLYSMGADGRTSKPLTAAKAYDDVVRANDGGFVGLGEDY